MLRPTYDTGAAGNAAPAGENVVFGTTNVAQGTARGVRPHEAGR